MLFPPIVVMDHHHYYSNLFFNSIMDYYAFYQFLKAHGDKWLLSFFNKKTALIIVAVCF